MTDKMCAPQIAPAMAATITRVPRVESRDDDATVAAFAAVNDWPSEPDVDRDVPPPVAAPDDDDGPPNADADCDAPGADLPDEPSVGGDAAAAAAAAGDTLAAGGGAPPVPAPAGTGLPGATSAGHCVP